MSFSHPRWSCRLDLRLIVAFSFTAWAQVALAQDVSLDFHIPSLMLPAALERYGDITGRNILYNSNMVIGWRSTAVDGHLSPDAALRKLLEGTRLSAVRVTSTSFTLLSAPDAVTASRQSAVTDYYGRIQLSLHDALCNAGSARPGNYRIGMHLWIGSAGNVTRYERVNSTGMSQVDATIDQALQHLKIGVRPPPELAQPVSIVILPQGPGITTVDGTSP